MIDKEFDLNKWDIVAVKLQQEYPQLTSADLIWRHETKADFYKMLATELGISTKKLEQIIENL